MTTLTLVFLVIAVGCALAFEFVNGFHDTANAVATVIYTRSLPPRVAVTWSGLCNFFGVQAGGIAVAYAIVNLLPMDLLVHSRSHEGQAMVMALLTAAIVWNLATWWKGLPASSSHALIGSILGVGLGHAVISGLPLSSGVNWGKVLEVGVSLLFSPILGFIAAAGLLVLVKKIFTDPVLHTAPKEDERPPLFIRAILTLTCTGVSFAHGCNDGQKGIGLVMLVIIGILPARFALQPQADARLLHQVASATRTVDSVVSHLPVARAPHSLPDAVLASAYVVAGAMERRHVVNTVSPTLYTSRVRTLLEGRDSTLAIPESDRWELRKAILETSAVVQALERSPQSGLSPDERARLHRADHEMRELTDYAPSWVMMLVALALGCGTMVGWKRIVVTVGEKIGKTHMTYAQGATAELVAMCSIGFAGVAGLPVSTTHVLASGIAGTMTAQRSGLQGGTVRNIALAWVLTLPVCMTLSGTLFWIFNYLLS